MSETTIEWTATRLPDGRVLPGYTFNIVWGCTKVGPPCDHCYAEAWAKRVGYGNLWGPDADRRTFGDKYWAQPLKWDRETSAAGIRRRVFCSSMADVFDNHPKLAPERTRLWKLIEATPKLDWLLLTKRVGNVMGMVPQHWQERFPSNVHMGATMGNQAELDRDIGKLTRIPAKVRFISFEPLLSAIDLPVGHIMTGFPQHITRDGRAIGAPLSIHQIIVGGESGPGARSMVLGWVKQIVRDCQSMGVPVFVKQLGAKPVDREDIPYPISDRKGALMEEWPESLRVREFPNVSR